MLVRPGILQGITDANFNPAPQIEDNFKLKHVYSIKSKLLIQFTLLPILKFNIYKKQGYIMNSRTH